MTEKKSPSHGCQVHDLLIDLSRDFCVVLHFRSCTFLHHFCNIIFCRKSSVPVDSSLMFTSQVTHQAMSSLLLLPADVARQCNPISKRNERVEQENEKYEKRMRGTWERKVKERKCYLVELKANTTPQEDYIQNSFVYHLFLLSSSFLTRLHSNTWSHSRQYSWHLHLLCHHHDDCWCHQLSSSSFYPCFPLPFHCRKRIEYLATKGNENTTSGVILSHSSWESRDFWKSQAFADWG